MIPKELKYTEKHEWVLVKDKTATVGITDYAQKSLGDITYVQLPEAGKALKQFGEMGVVESVKAASDIYSPVSGTVKEANSALSDAPEAINKDAYGAGWICKLENVNEADLGNLLSAEKYEELVKKLETE
ncbi:MAG: glycine cleavage system protein H [Elusimicrobia bacterium RIFOXYA2_FULL_39_19]|nr:MAG: glycine cleavage system protein H [Elusimicrobia bacterium RIFOXYA2_FULL_39_19]